MTDGTKRKASVSAPSVAQRVPAHRLMRWAVECLASLGMPDKAALLVAQSRIKMSLWGLDSHGVDRLPHDLEFLSCGLTSTVGEIAVESEGHSTARVDGGQQHGIIVAHDANQVAITLALMTGLGAVGVENPMDCGALALYTRRAAQGNLVGIAISRAGGMPTADSTGSPSRTVGTMVSIALPREDGCLAHLDVDGSTFLLNRAHAVRRDAADPAWGWGREVRQIIEVFVTPIRSQSLLPEVLSLAESSREEGPLFLVIDPSRLEGGRLVLAELERLVASLELQLDPLKTKADQESLEETVRRAIGIPIAPAVEKQITAWSESLKVIAPFNNPDCCPPAMQ